MARLKDIAVGTKDLYMLDPRIIKEKEGFNCRVDNQELRAHIRQLADSITEIGVQQPLTVYMDGDDPIITDGHCRLMATMLAISEGADIKSVPCRVEERTSNEADRTLSMLTRNSGKPLIMLEQAIVVKRLLAFGWSKADVVKKTGYSLSHVENLIVLSSAPVAVHTMVADGQVSATQAVKTVKKQGDRATATLATAVDTAKAAGKQKATAKHVVSPTPAAPVRVDWKERAVNLTSLIIAIRDAEVADRYARTQDAINYVNSLPTA